MPHTVIDCLAAHDCGLKPESRLGVAGMSNWTVSVYIVIHRII